MPLGERRHHKSAGILLGQVRSSVDTSNIMVEVEELSRTRGEAERDRV
mgnify:CR=1 FL=1